MPGPIRAREADDTACSQGSRSNVNGDFRHNPSYAGQAIYSPTTVAFYDLIVLTLSNPLVWRCPPDAFCSFTIAKRPTIILMSEWEPAGISIAATSRIRHHGSAYLTLIRTRLR